MSTSETYPRSVTPGIENQSGEIQMPPPGIYVGLDWLRFTGPEEWRGKLRDSLQEAAGTKPERTRGAAFFREGLIWKPGVMLSWSHPSKICQVDFQGGRLRLMDGERRIKIFRTLMGMGMKPTRIDAFIDFVDKGLDLYENAKASCERDELCRMRSYGDNSRRSVGKSPDRLHLNLGRRDSPVCGRIYDKGLETKTTKTAGRWERLEIEWKGDRVVEFAQRLYYARDEWEAFLTSFVLGAVDFREVNGQSKLSRRPRCDWWERVLNGHEEMRAAPALKSPDLIRWADAFRNSYGRRLVEMANAIDRPVELVVRWLLNDLDASDNGGQLVSDFVLAYRSGSR